MTTISSSWRRGLGISALCLGAAVLGATLQPATAQSGGGRATPPASSIAIIDMAKVSEAITEGEVIRKRLKDEETAYNAHIGTLKEKADKVNADLELLKGKEQTPEFRAKRAEKFELDATLKARFETSKLLLEVSEGESVRLLYSRILDAAARLGKDAGYDLVLVDDRYIEPPANATGKQVAGVMRDRRILYVSERTDITQQLITMMNNEFKAAKK